MATKNTINIHRYKQAPVPGWAGYAEDSIKSWILFFDDTGRALFYPTRHEDGSVGGIEPTAAG